MKRGKNDKWVAWWCLCVAMVSLIACSKRGREEDFRRLSWEQIEEQARGQHVQFSAWAGSHQINKYIQWVAEHLLQRYDIHLHHVPNNGGIEAMHILQREKATGKEFSSLDLVWINGAAFRLGREEQLLTTDIYSLVPHTKYVDKKNEAFFEDFTLPTRGDEVPWGSAQLIFFFREQFIARKINTYDTFFEAIKFYKGRFTYPQPPDFTGLTFVKGLFYVYADGAEREAYYREYLPEKHEHLVKKNEVWRHLDALHPFMWRKGKAFPKSYADLERMYKDGEIDFGMTFNPFGPQNNVILGTYPEDTVTFLPREGSIANAHFLALPKHSAAKEAALVSIHFLLSPQAQARKSDVNIWGDPTVIDLQLLEEEQRALFAPKNVARSAAPPKGVGIFVIKEFHATWEKEIEKEWKRRYLR